VHQVHQVPEADRRHWAVGSVQRAGAPPMRAVLQAEARWAEGAVLPPGSGAWVRQERAGC
jgi:hypothetical protein